MEKQQSKKMKKQQGVKRWIEKRQRVKRWRNNREQIDGETKEYKEFVQ